MEGRFQYTFPAHSATNTDLNAMNQGNLLQTDACSAFNQSTEFGKATGSFKVLLFLSLLPLRLEVAGPDADFASH